MIGECPSCHRKFQAPDDAVGKKVRCSGCQSMFVLQAASPSSPPAPSPAPPPAPKPPAAATPPNPPPKPAAKGSSPALERNKAAGAKQDPEKRKKKKTDPHLETPASTPSSPATSPKASSAKPATPKPTASKPAPAANPLDFGGPSAPAPDFNFAGSDKTSVGAKLKVEAAAAFMRLSLFFAVVPMLFQISWVALYAMQANPFVVGAVCCPLVVYPVAILVIYLGSNRMQQMRSPGMASTGALISVLLGIFGLLVGIGFTLFVGLEIASREFALHPIPSCIGGLAGLCALIQFIFSLWGGLRALLVLRKPEVREAMSATQ